jgi:hypothetical protein
MYDERDDEDSSSIDSDDSSEDECNEVDSEPGKKSNIIACLSGLENLNGCYDLNTMICMFFSCNRWKNFCFDLFDLSSQLEEMWPGEYDCQWLGASVSLGASVFPLRTG